MNARLVTKDGGGLVADVDLGSIIPNPDVVLWNMRVFVRDEGICGTANPNIYREASVALASSHFQGGAL